MNNKIQQPTFLNTQHSALNPQRPKAELTAKRLLANHGAGRLVVDVKVAGSVAEGARHVLDLVAPAAKDGASQRVLRVLLRGRESGRMNRGSGCVGHRHGRPATTHRDGKGGGHHIVGIPRHSLATLLSTRITVGYPVCARHIHHHQHIATGSNRVAHTRVPQPRPAPRRRRRR